MYNTNLASKLEFNKNIPDYPQKSQTCLHTDSLVYGMRDDPQIPKTTRQHQASSTKKQSRSYDVKNQMVLNNSRVTKA